MDRFTYPGNELFLFDKATRWKQYWAGDVSSFVKGRVLDVGAGLGRNAVYLRNENISEWCFVEPDFNLLAYIKRTAARVLGDLTLTTHHGTLQTLPRAEAFQTVLYIDVLEHIHDHVQELKRASRHLSHGGHLIVLAPAMPFLFSKFDDAIGHFRRYTKRSLTRISPGNCTLIRCRYLDSAGLMVSLANKYLLRCKIPTANQIQFWDRVLIPVSRIADRTSSHKIGKSICCIWKRTD